MLIRYRALFDGRHCDGRASGSVEKGCGDDLGVGEEDWPVFDDEDDILPDKDVG